MSVPRFAWWALAVALLPMLITWVNQFVPMPWGPVLVAVLGGALKAIELWISGNSSTVRGMNQSWFRRWLI